MKKLFILLIVPIILLSLMACGGPQMRPFDATINQYVMRSTGQTDAAGQALFARQLTTTNVVTNPTRVATFSVAALDIFEDLGFDNFNINLLGIPRASIPLTGLTYFEADQFINVGTLHIPSFEDLLLLNPELIILDGRTANFFEELQSTFPFAGILDMSNTTFSFESLERHVYNLGVIFPPMASVLNERVMVLSTQHQAIFTQVTNLLDGMGILVVMNNGANLSVFGPSARFQTIFHDFGFQSADNQHDQAATHGVRIDFEYLNSINPDGLILIDRAAAIGDESGLQSIMTDPQFIQLRAYQNNRIVILNPTAWYITTGGFIATSNMIADMNALLQAFIGA